MTAIVLPAGGTGIPSGGVEFFNGSTPVGYTVLIDNTATVDYDPSSLAPGTCSMTAIYSGSGFYSGSTSAAEALTVTTLSSATALTLSPSSVVVGSAGPVEMVAVVTPSSDSAGLTGTVDFYSGASQIGSGTLNGGAAAFNYDPGSLAVGTYSFSAVYGGNTIFSGSAAPVQTLSVIAPTGDFSVTASPSSLTIDPPGATGTTITITPSGGFSETIAFSSASCSGLPAGASCSFSPASVTPGSGPASTTLTVSMPAASVSAAHSRPRLAWLALLLPGFVVVRRRRSFLRWGLVVLAAALVAGAIAGCGSSSRQGSGSSGSSGGPGNYSVTITAKAPSDLTRSTTVKLVVN
jgi:hypothetical protein